MQDSVDRFLSALEAGNEFSQNTVSAYRNDLSQFVRHLQARNIQSWAEVEPTHLTTYVLEMKEKEYASSTVARKTAAVKSFFGYMVRAGELRADPADSLASPRVERYVPKAMTEHEIQSLLRQPGTESTPERIRDHAMLHVLYSTGMRVTELVSLDVDDVDLEQGTVCCTGKQNRRRHVELSPEAVQALSRYLAASRPAIVRDPNEPALFLNHRGFRLTRQGFWLILKSYAEAAGIGDITPHTLRHSFAAHQITRGRELGDVQRILGHVSISTTQVYQRIATQLGENGTNGGSVALNADEVAEAVEEALAAGPAR
jgi:integrase/recombinase XerD